MNSSDILRSISKSGQRFFILKKIGLDELNKCATAAALLEIHENNGEMLMTKLPSHFRRDKPTLIALGLATEQQTQTLGDNYKKIMSVSLTNKGQRLAKSANEKLQKAFNKTRAIWTA